MLLALKNRQKFENLSNNSIEYHNSKRNKQRNDSESDILSLPGITIIRLRGNHVENRLVLAVAGHIVTVSRQCSIKDSEGDAGKKDSAIDFVVICGRKNGLTVLDPSKEKISSEDNQNHQGPTKKRTELCPFIPIFPVDHIWDRRLYEFVLSFGGNYFFLAANSFLAVKDPISCLNTIEHQVYLYLILIVFCDVSSPQSQQFLDLQPDFITEVIIFFTGEVLLNKLVALIEGKHDFRFSEVVFVD